MKRSSALVSYSESSDSDSDHAPNVPEPKKRKLPALASSLTVPVPVDDPSKHQGRIRTTPHVEGQWAAYVYIPILLQEEENKKLRGLVRRVIRRAKDVEPALQVLGTSAPANGNEVADSAVPMELHVSLTRPFYLRAHQREDVKRAMRAVAKTHLPFTASFATLAELTNDERTRTFLCMEVGAGHTEFQKLSDALTPTLRAFRQKEYYDQPRFHASFAWALLNHPSQPSTPAPPGTPTPEPDAVSKESPSPPICTPIAALPDDLVSSLQAEFGSALASQAGVFDVQTVRVRIGKDVSEWALG
ncbi:hypothetical protein EWM64_g10503 [Hericium alpestre]|uniref:U6 snRNA phosphodiesterase n=1 Tax=Hericium alpestre TaxID=135208 RepID=A0A4Y9ZJ78_9AGAM|nr:hypothetical protein EWM64_g10503 [Hericium alpestre]